MLRISEFSENGKTTRLRLDGTITAASFADLEASCLRHLNTSSSMVLLDMGGVAFMSDEAAKKLAGLRGKGLRIINGSPFIEALLQAVER